jgi:hypothetical protein
MNRHLTRLVASVTTVSVLSLTGAGMATATTVAEPPTASAETSNSSTVEQLKALQGKLVAGRDAGDAVAVLDSVNKLRPVLAQVRVVERSSSTLHVVEEADDTAAQIQQKLDLPGLGGLPNPLQLVTGLLTSLLDLITTLLSSLLGSLPVPVPDLPVDLPVPLPLP